MISKINFDFYFLNDILNKNLNFNNYETETYK